jgi:Flp pilus assembly protein TadG
MSTRTWSRARLRLGSQRGNAVVEFALLAPLLFIILFGITEFGRAFGATQALYSAAREGARLAAVTEPDQAAVTARINQVLAAAGVTPSGITVAGPNGGADPTITVTVTSDFTVLPGNLLGTFTGTIPLRATCVMRHEG